MARSPALSAAIAILARLILLALAGWALAATGGAHPSIGSVVATGAVAIALALLSFGD
jgi:hypothetical protein